MQCPLTASEILSREFLGIRARLLSVAATLDRLDRAEGTVAEDPRRHEINQALEILLRHAPHRAEQVQLLFSRPYDPAWKEWE